MTDAEVICELQAEVDVLLERVIELETALCDERAKNRRAQFRVVSRLAAAPLYPTLSSLGDQPPCNRGGRSSSEAATYEGRAGRVDPATSRVPEAPMRRDDSPCAASPVKQPPVLRFLSRAAQHGQIGAV